MSDSVKSSALVSVWVDKQQGTIQDVRDWLAEVERLRIPDTARLDECFLSLSYTSEVLDSIMSESELGVEGYDILVGLPR